MREHLLERVQMLVARLSWLGICPDIAALSLADLWGAYRFLHRVANA